MAKKKDTVNPRRSIQSEIVARHGEKAVEEAKKRLCNNCIQERSCLLLPLCLDGSDCPYLRKMEVKRDA